MATDSVFSNEPVVEDKTADITVDALVGENQKYKSVDELAKAYANADSFIERLKAEKAEAEAEAKVLKDLVTGQNKQPNKADENPDGIQTPPAGEREPNKDVDLKSLIQEEINRTNSEKRRADNVNLVADKLAESLGDANKARAYVQKKAAELGVGVDFLMDTAAKSPNAFYNLVGLNSQRPQGTPSPETNFRPNNGDNGKKGKSYFENIRKTNPGAYYSRQVQEEMFTAVNTLGQDYFTT
jgi:uncharacterized small protein (DUF1192 family)